MLRRRLRQCSNWWWPRIADLVRRLRRPFRLPVCAGAGCRRPAPLRDPRTGQPVCRSHFVPTSGS
ncbi:MAG: hypothetical protein OXC13_15780 [Caldilineaceae bacterium]|nr:hypothetical protein [Caldilineaceae bacterium]